MLKAGKALKSVDRWRCTLRVLRTLRVLERKPDHIPRVGKKMGGGVWYPCVRREVRVGGRLPTVVKLCRLRTLFTEELIYETY